MEKVFTIFKKAKKVSFQGLRGKALPPIFLGGISLLGLSWLWRLDLHPRSLKFTIIEDDRCQNHPWDARQALPDQKTEQGEPHRILNTTSDDLAVEEVLKLVQDDKVRQGDNTKLHRLSNSDTKDDGVAHEVSDDRQESTKKCNYYNNERVGHG